MRRFLSLFVAIAVIAIAGIVPSIAQTDATGKPGEGVKVTKHVKTKAEAATKSHAKKASRHAKKATTKAPKSSKKKSTKSSAKPEAKPAK